MASLGSHTFDYDANSLRTRKNEIAYTYIGGKLIREENSGHTIDYIYGNDGITGIKYNGTVYIFRKNVFGDVTHIYDTNGVLHAHYVYDAWGNHTVVNDTETEIGTINPIRYRGYYYDTETNLYYLRARYYDPETGRFVSQDNISYLAPEHFSGLNLYAYCNDNPVYGYDPNGTWTFSSGWSFSAFLVGGATYSFNVSIDDNWNLAFQVSKANIFKDQEGATFGLASIGVSRSYSYTKLDTVDDLNGFALNTGLSVPVYGPVSVGGEVISSPQDPLNVVGGSIEVGVGAGIDAHVVASVTQPIKKFNIVTFAKNAWSKFKSWLGV